MSIFKKLVVAVLAMSLVASLAGCGSNTVAVVNGEKITKDHFDIRVKKTQEQYQSQGAQFNGDEGKKMVQAIEQQVLDQMIEEELIKQEAKKQGVQPSKEETTKRVQEIKASFPSEGEFKKVLKGYSMDEKDLGEWIGTQMTQDALFAKVTKDIKANESELKAYYENNKDKFAEPEKISVRHILIQVQPPAGQSGGANPHAGQGKTDAEAKKEIEAIYAELKAGKDFTELAKAKSNDPGVAQNEGLYTLAQDEPYAEEFKKAAFALKNVGDITKEPAKTEFGYHIIKLEKKIPAKQLTFEEAKSKIQEQLIGQKKQEATQNFVNKLKSSAKIEKKLKK